MTLSLSRRQLLTFGAAAAHFTALGSLPGGLRGRLAGAALAEGPFLVPEMSMGDPNAPVKVVEYGMFTCPHCANFARQVFPLLKANYIDTGKVYFTFREVYFNRPSLWAAMIARCAPEDRYFGIVDELFRTQSDWAGVMDTDAMMQALYGIGRQAGLTDAAMDACVSDRAKAEALVKAFQDNAARDGIDATPTFLVNGEKQSNMDYGSFSALIDGLLPK